MPQILDAALEEFAERGYGGARMAAVAERAGIAKGLIYHYVPSKQALFSATVRACTQPAFEAAERQVAACTGSARDLLAALLAIAYERVAGHPREKYRGHPFTFWQYTGTGVVPGISGQADINVFNGSAAAWKKWVQANSG